MDFGGLFGAAGSIANGLIASSAANKAAKTQANAIKDITNRIQTDMSPETLQRLATQGDIQRAQQQRDLFQKMFPDLASAQAAAGKSLSAQAAGYGADSNANQVANAATKEALGNIDATKQGQSQLIDAALAQLKAGATLPPDVEAQLVQAGLESSGMVTQHASGQGIGGQQLRTILGTAGIQLQQQRQQLASGLLQKAQDLETQRQQTLGELFPRLAQTQLANTQGAGEIFNITQSATPQAGLSGTQLANSWLSRIGALNQTQAQGAAAKANNQLVQGQIMGNAVGGAIGGIGSMGLGGMFGGQQPGTSAQPITFSSIANAGGGATSYGGGYNPNILGNS